MTVTTVFAVVPSADLATAHTWWTRLLGREPDRVPMPTDIEWLFPAGGGLQLVDDSERAGAGSVTLGVDDVDTELDEIAGRGLEVPRAQTVPTGQFRLAMTQDPDGNTVVLAQELTVGGVPQTAFSGMPTISRHVSHGIPRTFSESTATGRSCSPEGSGGSSRGVQDACS